MSRVIAARAAQAAADAEVLAGAGFVADVLARLAAAIDDLQGVRWPALTGAQVAAGVPHHPDQVVPSRSRATPTATA